MKVYICGRCGGPIIFRYASHQIYHIPSGWHCWGGHKGEKPQVYFFKTTTSKTIRSKLKEKFKYIFESNEKKGDEKPPMRFVKNLWKQKRADVVHDFLAFLTDIGSDYANDLIQKISLTDEWDRYYRIRKKYPLSRKR